MRRSLIVALVFGAALMVFAGPASAGDNFAAPMSGDAEVPSVDTQAAGVATFKLGDEGLAFKVNVANIDNVIAAHIHCGAVGVNGPVGVTLFRGGPDHGKGAPPGGGVPAPRPGEA